MTGSDIPPSLRRAIAADLLAEALAAHFPRETLTAILDQDKPK